MAHTPNFDNLRRAILRQGPPGAVPLYEIFADTGMVEAVLGEKFPIDLYRFIQEPSPVITADSRHKRPVFRSTRPSTTAT